VSRADGSVEFKRGIVIIRTGRVDYCCAAPPEGPNADLREPGLTGEPGGPADPVVMKGMVR
jgi:hypothetical protein